jgi:hypothetical protein
MPRVKVGPATPDRETLDLEVARLRDLDIRALRNHWQAAFGRPSPPHLPRQLLFRILAYRVQADQLGDLDAESRRLLDSTESPEKAAERTLAQRGQVRQLNPGIILGREWKGRMHRVTVLPEGFAWNGRTYPSLSTIALAITGTRWNGPRFFGLRDKITSEARP